MSYEILKAEEGIIIVHITSANFDSFKGWRVEFDNGKEALLYNRNNKLFSMQKNG